MAKTFDYHRRADECSLRAATAANDQARDSLARDGKLLAKAHRGHDTAGQAAKPGTVIAARVVPVDHVPELMSPHAADARPDLSGRGIASTRA